MTSGRRLTRPIIINRRRIGVLNTVATMEFVKPRWLRDFLRFLPLKSQFVLSGNVYDLQVHGEPGKSPATVSLQAALAREFYAASYRRVVSLDLVRGVRLLSSVGAFASSNELLQRWGL